MQAEKVYLKEIEWPDFGSATPVIYPSSGEIESRIEKCREMMRARSLTHLVVYADREHCGNLMYLAHFDPRFEEALLIIKEQGVPLLLVGNECVSHLTVSPIFNDSKLRFERYQPFSLISQPRDESRSLREILSDEVINEASKVGCIGWKYFTEIEFLEYEAAIELPHFIVNTLQLLCGKGNVVNASDILMSPVYGLKAACSAFEIAHFEFSNVMASEGVINLLKNFRYDVTDFELVREYQFTGYPLGCHVGLKSSGNKRIGLSSPVGALVKKGDSCSVNLSYWGSNICRAGWVVESEDDLPVEAKDYIEKFAAPYFSACVKWLENIRIGTKGKVLYDIISGRLPFEDFQIFLNPGHLIHYEEWVSSPVYKNSEDEIRSGMYFQVDIIPHSEKYYSSRMEDGIIIADEELRMQVKQQYPETYDRCMRRREFMKEELGIALPEEVLPLSNMPALVPPFFLNYKKVFSLKS
ncbi:hypothetical protein F1649_10035 [Arcticibacter tournemirensis]|uniref:M24 family metallopeptidase n=1 Tax=Arcticibacter tournemirensis TaxID=699437 RepID=A0A5M9H910_9SPHI|nr:hypothetical protein [Arcticibacter tournemirensis]KAA8483140.1 hypothetical protein F1649_10035 [Arcticibacter tournemirensis]